MTFMLPGRARAEAARSAEPERPSLSESADFAALREAASDLGAAVGSLLEGAGPAWSLPPRPSLARLAGAEAEAAGAAALATLLREAAASLRALPSIRDVGAAQALADARMILPIARSVVGFVPRKTEEATMALLDRFKAVEAASDKAAESSRGLLDRIEGRGSVASVSAVAERSRAAMEAERAAVSRIVASNRGNAATLRDMSREIEAGIALVEEIEEITDRSRLIAFNMAVEAAHIGDKGRGFRVIVGELRKINDRTVEFSKRIVALLSKYKEYGIKLGGEMEEHSKRLNEEVVGGIASSGEAVEALISSSVATEELSRHLASISLEVRGNLDHVIEALQFQDITRQMLEGALGMMDDLGQRMKEAELQGPAPASTDRIAELRRFRGLQDSYLSRVKTKEEKLAIKEAEL